MFWTIAAAALFLQSLTPHKPEMTLPKRFAVPVRVEHELDPSHARIGDRIELRISHDLRWQGCLVFRKDAAVISIVSEVHGPGVVGTPSLIVLDIQMSMAADGTIVPLSGTIRAEGEDRTMESIGAAAGVCCLGFFLPGGRKSIGKGVGTMALTTTEIRIRCTEN